MTPYSLTSFLCLPVSPSLLLALSCWCWCCQCHSMVATSHHHPFHSIHATVSSYLVYTSPYTSPFPRSAWVLAESVTQVATNLKLFNVQKKINIFFPSAVFYYWAPPTKADGTLARRDLTRHTSRKVWEWHHWHHLRMRLPWYLSHSHWKKGDGGKRNQITREKDWKQERATGKPLSTHGNHSLFMSPTYRTCPYMDKRGWFFRLV